MRSLIRRRRTALLLGAAVASMAVIPLVSAGSSTAAARVGGKNVLANLWEWNWPSVADECTKVLGPAGYAGVQVAPPQDSLKRTALGNGSDTILHPWWEVYQPVDYNLTSRMGNEAQFKSMVKTCRKAGVKVYVDAVINHMTGQGNISYGGQPYTHFDYPGVYTVANFHQKGSDCTSADGLIADYNNLLQVRKCELVGLADLRTETDAVQTKLAAYLNKLIGYGVSGFRVDAAKHIGQPDMLALEKRLHKTVDGTRPYIALEVFPGGPGVLAPQAFQNAGSLLGLDTDKQIRDAFKSYPDEHIGSLATLKVFGEDSGLVPSDHALNFVQNHDTERNGDALSYKDGKTNILANQFLLAYGYGTPQVYSSFTWTTSDDSPPADANGLITNTDCAPTSTTWACVDRDQGVVAMVGWHNYVGTTAVKNWWDDSDNVIAFSRGNRGWVAMNNGPADKTYTFNTGLAAGTYCNVIGGSLTGGACSGTSITVNSAGQATVTVPTKTAVAISRAAVV